MRRASILLQNTPFFVLTYQKGLFVDTWPEEILELHEDIVNFQEDAKGSRLFVIFVQFPLSKHWVSYLLHMPNLKELSKNKQSKL